MCLQYREMCFLHWEMSIKGDGSNCYQIRIGATKKSCAMVIQASTAKKMENRIGPSSAILRGQRTMQARLFWFTQTMEFKHRPDEYGCGQSEEAQVSNVATALRCQASPLRPRRFHAKDIAMTHRHLLPPLLLEGVLRDRPCKITMQRG